MTEQASAQKFKQSLIDDATEYQKSAGLISFDEANKLWASACDGPGVTDTEFATLAHILAEFKFTYKAREYLDKLVTKQISGSSMYKQINGVKYDRSALDLAEHLHKDGKIDVGDAKKLWKDVEDGPGVTETEKRTIAYIRDTFTLTDGAKEFFASQLGEEKEDEVKEEEKVEEETAKEEKEEAAEEEAADEEMGKEEEEEEDAAPRARSSRERKQVEQFVPEMTTKEDKPFVVPEGKGTPLGDIENVRRRMDATKAVESHIKRLHSLCFPGQKGNKNNLKSHLRQFKGFDPNDDKIVEQTRTKLNASTNEKIKELMDLCDVHVTGAKEDRITALVEWLSEPVESGKPYATKSTAGTKRKKSTKKKKASTKKKKAKKDNTPKKLSAFIHFGMEMRPKLKKEHPDSTFGELGKLLGEAWRGADEKTKKKFEKIAAESVPVAKKAKTTPKKKTPAKKKAKKEVSSSEEEESEEEASDSDAPLTKGMSSAMKDKVKEIIDAAEDLGQLTRKQIKSELNKTFDDVDDHSDELKAFIVKCVKANSS